MDKRDPRYELMRELKACAGVFELLRTEFGGGDLLLRRIRDLPEALRIEALSLAGTMARSGDGPSDSRTRLRDLMDTRMHALEIEVSFLNPVEAAQGRAAERRKVNAKARHVAIPSSREAREMNRAALGACEMVLGHLDVLGAYPDCERLAELVEELPDAPREACRALVVKSCGVSSEAIDARERLRHSVLTEASGLARAERASR